MKSSTIVTHLIVLLFIAFLGGCAKTVRPTDLKVPEALSCIEVPEGVEVHEVKGLGKFDWTTKLTPGPYIAEREDAEGTFYRAPPGGIYIGRDDLADKPPIALMPRTFDGGIWVPRDSKKPPHLYTYFSTQEAAIVPLPANASCSTAFVVQDPQSQGVSAVAFALGGAVGGAAGGVAGRAIADNSQMSYGEAAGVGAAGGALGGLVVAGLINMDVGKIVHHPAPTDPGFRGALEALALKVVQVPASAPAQEAATKDP